MRTGWCTTHLVRWWTAHLGAGPACLSGRGASWSHAGSAPQYHVSGVAVPLAEHIGGGNRSAYVRGTLKAMESLRRAERLRDLQSANRRRLAEQDASAEDLPDLIGEAYQARGSELSGPVAT